MLLIRDHTGCSYIPVLDVTFVVLGSYLKNDVDITELFMHMESFQMIYSRIGSEQLEPSTLSLMTWSLYIFSSHCFDPGMQSPQIMNSVTECVNRLTDILSIANNYELRVN